MTVISGKAAYINSVHCLVNWAVTEDVALERYAASCTNGATGVADGNVNWNGTASGLGGTPPLMPTGNDFTFKGVIDNALADNLVMDGTIRVSQTQITIPVAQGGPIRWSATWGAQGLLTEGTVGATDTVGPEPDMAKNGQIRIAANLAAIATPTVLTDVQNITLTFNRPESTYVDAGATKRLVGNLEADVAFEILHRSFVNSLYAKNTFGIIRAYVSAATYWELSVKFGSKGPMTIDTASNQPVGYTVNSMYSSVVPAALNSTFGGWIKNPALVYFHGAAPS